MERVFVSYSRNNLATVTNLIQDLKAVGIEAWHDQTLTGGQRWWDNILAQIRNCEVFVFALSPEALDSEACKSELSYVSQLGKAILPVLVAEEVNLNLLSYPLNEIQVTDYRRRDKDAAFALVKAIYKASAPAPLPDPLPNPPPVPVSYLATLKERINTSDALDPQEQKALVFELEAGLREGRSLTEIRDLLLSLKRRDDLLAKVASMIDAALDSIDASQLIKPPTAQERHLAASEPLNEGSVLSAQRGYEDQLLPQSPGKPGDTVAVVVPSIHCPHCSAQVDGGSAFCSACGSTLAAHGNSKAQDSKVRRYVCSPGDCPRLIADLKHWLDGEGFDSQQMPTEHQRILLQIKKRGGWRNLVGMSTSLNIVFGQSSDTLMVEIGAGKWIDKAVVGTVSIFVLWPLAVTAGVGAWQQMKMPEKIFDYIERRLSLR